MFTSAKKRNEKKLRFGLYFPFTPSIAGIPEDEITKTHNRTFAEVLAAIAQVGEWECEQIYLTNQEKMFTINGKVLCRFFPLSFRQRGLSQSFGRQWSLSALLDLFLHPPDSLAIFQAYGLFAKALALTAKIRRVPYMVIVGGWYAQISRSQQWYFNHAFHVLVHTQMQKQALVDAGYSASNIDIFPLGINTELFSKKSPEQYLKHNDWPRLLYVGRLQPSKGVFEALLTFDVVKRHFPQATMKIVGPCNDQIFMERMERYINENNLQGAITFVGPVDYKNLPQYYQNADIFLFPSSYEGLPSVVLESMACGTPPVVIRGSGGTEEAVLHGKTGWVVDIPRLAYDVQQILAEPAQLQSIGEQAALRVREMFSSQRTYDILSSLLSKIAHD